VLLVVVLGFFAVAVGLVTQSVYREVEADLFAAAQLIARDLASGEAARNLEISRTYWHRFGPAPRDRAYFIVWNRAGAEIARSEGFAGRVTRDRALAGRELPRREGPRPYLTRHDDGELQVLARGPQDELILIGRPLGKERDRLRGLWLSLLGFGSVALVLGAAVSWWLAWRVTRPLEQLTQAAEQISPRAWGDRLTTRAGNSELQRLTLVFNQMLDRLQQAFEQQTRFTSDASHELRTPVSVILTQTDHSLTRPRTNEEYQAALETCRRSARRMKHLVDDLLLLARADAGQLPLRRVLVDLAEVTASTIAWLQPLAEERGVRLSAELTSTPVQGDAQQLSQVVANLVTNAVKYSPAAGEVRITVAREADPSNAWAVLRVRDQGPGIAAEDQPRIFERFFRGDRARTNDSTDARLGPGIGLGLSIAAEVVAAHGGSISLLSESGPGATLEVRLPLAEPSPG
jgi:heavy metal sensor kinase